MMRRVRPLLAELSVLFRDPSSLPYLGVKRSEGGFALLITLLVVLLLAVLIFEIDFQARADLRAASNFRDDFSAYSIARSGIAVAQQALKEDAKNPDTGAFDATTELWALPIESYAVRDGMISGKVTDEAGKINLNMLVPISTVNLNILKWRKAQLARLFTRLEVNPELVDAIIDWIDKNNETESHGAENDFYEFSDPPYSAKNGPMETLQELLFVKGISVEIYKKIVPYLTVYTDGLLNVNTADSMVFQSMHELITEDNAEQMISSRPYATKNNFIDLNTSIINTLNPGNILDSVVGIKSDIFSIEVTGTVRDTQKVIRAVWNRQTGQFLHFQVE